MNADHDALIFAAAQPAALCTLVGIDGSFSRRVGAQLAVAADGTMAGDMADKCLDSELAGQALKAMADGHARLLRYGEGSPFIDFRLPCGSGLDVLIDPTPDRMALQACVDRLAQRQEAALALSLPEGAAQGLLNLRQYIPPPRLLVLGAGSECKAMARLAQAQGIAIDWREAGEDMALGRVPPGLEADCWSAILLLFHDHEWEHALLDWALATPAFYIGAQGGAPARTSRLERLRARGVAENQLARIRGPVGLIPSARDSQVLALSILADVIAAHEALHPHR